MRIRALLAAALIALGLGVLAPAVALADTSGMTHNSVNPDMTHD